MNDQPGLVLGEPLGGRGEPGLKQLDVAVIARNLAR